MDITTMKLLEKKSKIPFDVIRHVIQPYAQFEKLTNDTIRIAVKMYVDDKADCIKKFGQIENWNVSLVTNMCALFKNLRNFNADISRWNVSKCTNMRKMFFNAISFNADISNWDVSSVTTMSLMFWYAVKFNANISKWNVSNCINMRGAFYHATNFNADISNWDVSNCIVMNHMFYNALSFDNQTTQNWNIHPNTPTHYMFGHF